MADVLARLSSSTHPSPAKDKSSSSKKRRKGQDGGTTGGDDDNAASAKFSKRQKTIDSSDVLSPPPPPRQRPLKASPVPLPQRSPSPPAQSTRTTTAPVPAKKAIGPEEKRADNTEVVSQDHVSVNGRINSPQLLRRTPVLPPPLSPAEKGPELEKDVKTSKQSKRKRTDANVPAPGRAPTLVNGISEEAQTASRESRSKTLTEGEAVNGIVAGGADSSRSRKRKRLQKVKPNNPVTMASTEAANPATLPNGTSERKKTKSTDLIEEHPQNVANLDPTNEITGRELPQSRDQAEVPSGSPSPPTARKKKKKKEHTAKNPMEPFVDTITSLKDTSDQPQSEKASKKDKRSSKTIKSKFQDAPTDAEEPATPSIEVNNASSTAVTKARRDRDMIRQNINVSRDFGLEGALTFPTGPGYNTGFHLFNAMLYLNVPPLGSGYPLHAAVNLGISQFLFNYYPPAKGILICHTNHRICPPPNETEESLTRISDGYASSNLWISADLYIFRPTRGAWLRGNISLQHESHISVMIMGHWPASVARKRLPKSWRWVPDDDDALLTDDVDDTDLENTPFLRLGGAGYWCDGAGQPVMGQVVIRALDFDVVTERAGGTVVSIEASMLDEEQDREANLIDELSVPMQQQQQSSTTPKQLPSWRQPAAITETAESNTVDSAATDTDADAHVKQVDDDSGAAASETSKKSKPRKDNKKKQFSTGRS